MTQPPEGIVVSIITSSQKSVVEQDIQSTYGSNLNLSTTFKSNNCDTIFFGDEQQLHPTTSETVVTRNQIDLLSSIDNDDSIVDESSTNIRIHARESNLDDRITVNKATTDTNNTALIITRSKTQQSDGRCFASLRHGDIVRYNTQQYHRAEIELNNIEFKQAQTDSFQRRENGTNHIKRLMESSIIDLTSDQSGDSSDSCNEDDWIDWSDKSQVQFMEIERISVHDLDASKRVTEHRRNGTPVIITKHVGWAQFAQRWLIPIKVEEEEEEEEIFKTSKPTILSNGFGGAKTSTIVERKCDTLLDLSKPHQLNFKQMIQDIGKELVPVIPRKYDEYNPTKVKIPVEEFLFQGWPDMEDERRQQLDECFTTFPYLYLHQWQFPLSSSRDVVSMLCGPGKNNPLPNNVLGDDLLSYWLDKAKCNGDSPYQYLFMGREATKSKLHRDGGGLVITIAPIMGLKEVTLVHRDCGAKLYHLNADIDNVDLDSHPMLYDIRAWKSVVRPGEILIMPEGTYHQCTNITPCFSYHRFFLDTVNLPSFLDSYYTSDAKEISHDEVIWNAAHALMRRIDNHIEFIHTAQTYSIAKTSVPDKIKDAIYNLRCLRHISCEFLVRVYSKTRVRGQTVSLMREYNHWNGLVFDIDETLHSFRNRFKKNLPILVQDSKWRCPVYKKRRRQEE